MAKLEQLQPNAAIRGIVPDALVSVVSVQWYGSDALELAYKTPQGSIHTTLLYRDSEPTLEIADQGRPWSFDGDGALFRLVSEAQRIRLAHLFDPVLAVHTSNVDPLPHQITAVYEHMLPRLPLRYLLADDPGAGKTIMAGLLIKELIARGDLQRCLIVCPGSLAEQWQDELYQRFHLPFEILTNDKLDSARTGNWFLENDLVIARLDKLSRNEDLQEKLKAPDCGWDLVVCDEAHKMSATVFSGETKYTKRYHLGRLLSELTRNFLLMTATPHNGKEADFQLFMALLDGDRFEGRYRDGVHASDVSDLMRRMVKEDLRKFDGSPLFPPRIAYTVPYSLSSEEAALYSSVTEYVREQFNRAEALANDKRSGTVGFALTILQRRLASSPEAIYKSLERRRARLESRLRDLEVQQKGVQTLSTFSQVLDDEDIQDIEDGSDAEAEAVQEEVLDQATAARTIEELRLEIGTLRDLEGQALALKRSGNDTKWRELSGLLGQLFSMPDQNPHVAEPAVPYSSGAIPPPVPSPSQKLVIFTEHRDTLAYLESRVTRFLGRSDAVRVIHGGVGREQRLDVQEAFWHQPNVQVLIATDAAGEGINLQRGHLMVNYDLPWNPNRLEQRFGRIHRIGQKEICYLWNLVADDTREGDVYRRLLDKLELARAALGGQVFDVLGKLAFEDDGKVLSLRDLMIKAIREGEEGKIRLQQEMEAMFDKALAMEHVRDLLEEHQLEHETMDTSAVQRIRENMERADARRLQPHYIESFFVEAFSRLGGNSKPREPRRYEISHVPAMIRQRDRIVGGGAPVQPRYERIAFDKSEIAPEGMKPAAFVCPGHPLLNAVLDLTLERNRDLLKRGTILIDERDSSSEPRVLFFLEHAIQDASLPRGGLPRIVSKRLLYVEMSADGSTRHLHYAPYLDYRPLTEGEPAIGDILDRAECQWIDRALEDKARGHAVAQVVPGHLAEIRDRKLALIVKTEAAVKDRLTKEISYWDHRAEELKHQEQAGKTNAKLNSQEARKRADLLQARLQRRLDELKREAQISPLPPVVLGGVLVVPRGLLDLVSGRSAEALSRPIDTQTSAARARAIVMDVERKLGFEPVDVELQKLGYDIESHIPGSGKLRFIEVKGRIAEADTITVTTNEILYSLNKPDDYVLAIVEFIDAKQHRVHYLRRPFKRPPDFHATGVLYKMSELIARAEAPN